MRHTRRSEVHAHLRPHHHSPQATRPAPQLNRLRRGAAGFRQVLLSRRKPQRIVAPHRHPTPTPPYSQTRWAYKQ